MLLFLSEPYLARYPSLSRLIKEILTKYVWQNTDTWAQSSCHLSKRCGVFLQRIVKLGYCLENMPCIITK